MDTSNLSMLIDQIAKEKNVKRPVVIKAVEKAYTGIAKKKFNGIAKIEALFDEADNSIQIFKFKKVVEVAKSQELEVSVADAQHLDEDAVLGDEVGINVTDQVKYSRNDINTLRHVIISLINNETKTNLINEFSNKLQKLVTGVVKKVDENHLLVDLGKTEAILHKTHLIGDETFRVHDKIQAVLMEVSSTPQGAELRLSRKHPLFVYLLLKKEIPDIEDGTIEIKNISRVAGKRTHILVSSDSLNEQKILQNILGSNGYKIQNVTNQMDSESIKIIVDSNDLNHTLGQLLKPIQYNKVFFDEESLTLVIDSNDVGKVIGSKGYNLTLIASTLNKKVDLVSDVEAKKYNNECSLFLKDKGVDENICDIIAATSLVLRKDLTTETVSKSLQVNQEKASEIKNLMSDFIKKHALKVEAYAIPRGLDLTEFNNPGPESQRDLELRTRQKLREELNLKY